MQNKLNTENNGKNIISFNSSTPNISTPNPITPSGSLNISEKEIIFKMEDLQAAYYTIYILQDGRLASGGNSTSIIIYNNQTFKSEMTIKEYSNYIMHLTQLKNGNLVSLGADAYINIYSLLDNYKYIVLQKIKNHTSRIHKLREIDNNKFMTCSDDNTIKFFFKDKNEYKEDYTLQDDITINDILRTKEKEIVYSGYNNSYFIRFYDLKSRKKIDSTKVTNFYAGLSDFLYMMCQKYLLVETNSSIIIFDVNQHRQIREIQNNISYCITSFLKIDETTLLSVNCGGKINQWIIDDDNLIFENTKEKSHNGQIRMIRRNQEGLIITCSDDNSIKVWA